MIPVTQTKFGPEEGNCFSACVASILELGIEDVPHFCAYSNKRWLREAEAWLRENYNLTLLSFASRGTSGVYCIPAIHHILSGQSVRGLCHSVVGFRGKVVHDPHPSRKGIVEIEEYGFLIPLGSYGGHLMERKNRSERHETETT